MEFSTILEAIAFHAINSPDKTCLIEAETDRLCTYAELWHWSRAFSMRLRNLGIRKGDRVVVRVGGLLETYTAIFGIFLSGAVFCPVEKNLPKQRMTEMLEHYDAQVYVSKENTGDTFSWIDMRSLCISNLPDDPESEPASFPAPDDFCVVYFTTGTTGKPKGVKHTFRAQMKTELYERYNWKQDTVFYLFHPLHANTVLSAGAAVFYFGLTLIHQAGSIFAASIFEAIRKYPVTDLFMQVYVLTVLLKSDALCELKSKLRSISIGGALTPAVLIEKLRRMLPDTRLYIHYGPTEASLTSIYDIAENEYKANCIGRPLNGVKFSILDENYGDKHAATRDDPGIIALESPSLMLGYWKSPELTKRAIVNGRLITTDIGFIGEDSDLYILGRRDDVISSGGHKMAPYEIEECALLYPDVEEAICVAAPHEILGAVPCLFVIIREGGVFSPKEIIRFLSGKLESYKVPKIIRRFDEFPLVPGSAKIDRKELRKYV